MMTSIRRTSSGSGGKNARLLAQPKVNPAIEVAELPFLLNPNLKKFDNRHKIYNWFAKLFAKYGITTSEMNALAMNRLAIAAYTWMVALRAIDSDPMEPMVGKKCAWAVSAQSATIANQALRNILASHFEVHCEEEEPEPETPASVLAELRNAAGS